MAKLCMGCMNPLPEGNPTCTICGFDPAKDQNPEHCLPITTSLQGHYIVGRLMGEFPDHLLYLAYDRQMKEPCFIQEFFPAAIARRDTIGGVQPKEGRAPVFEEYANEFRGMMRVLARMRELPGVVTIYDIFEENGTVYSVSDYCQGMTLTKKVKLSGGRIPWPEARSIFMSLLASLVQLNDAGLYHLAICPDNILIGSDGRARLRNFSLQAARHAGTNLTTDFKPGYTAPEQYYADEEIGAPADVYALAATIFYTVTGTEPPAGDKRAKNSDDLFMSAEVAEELTQPVCVALFNALQVFPERRTATLALLRDELSVTPKVSALVDEANSDIAAAAVVDVAEEEAEEQPEGEKKGNGLLIGMLVASLGMLLVAVIIIIILLFSGSILNRRGNDGGDVIQTTTTTTTRPTGTGDEAVVDNVVGMIYYDRKDDQFNGMPLELLGFAYDMGQPEGAILYQYPAANELQPEGTPIQVIVNNPRATVSVEIPDVSGWDEESARTFLEVLGFEVKTRVAVDATSDRGTVESTYPPAGNAREVGEIVTLMVSDKEPEPEKVVVPDLSGWTEEYAVKTLRLLNLQVQINYNDQSNLTKGTVESVEGAGSEVAVGSTVIINVSNKSSLLDDWLNW